MTNNYFPQLRSFFKSLYIFWKYLCSVHSIVFAFSPILKLKVGFFSLGFVHFIHDSCFTVPLTGLLGVSHEWFHWRMGLFHFHILAGYGNFGYTTSIFFHCHLSLHLPFKWEFSIQIQSESHSKYEIFLANFWLEF